MTYAIRGRMLFGTHLEPGTLVVEDNRIATIHRGEARDADLPATVIDAEIVSPGLIDLQVNGGWGRECTASPDDINHISREMLPTGATAWLPTIVTSAAETYPPLFAAWETHDDTAGAIPLGYHLEGPFLTLEKKGAHNPDFILAASEELFVSWLNQPSIALVTLSPEREGALGRIRRLVEQGYLVSLGHTNATYEAFIAGIDAGARMATHLFNAMTAIHHRAPGAMVGTLVDDRVTAGLIPDGIHSHPATVRLAIKTKGLDHICLVTDMMAATGLGPGTYALGTMDVTVDETSARLADGTLAGSILTADQAIRNLVDWSDCTAGEALFMMTANPASLLQDASRGRLVSGTRADITLFDEALIPTATIVGGQPRWQAAGQHPGFGTM